MNKTSRTSGKLLENSSLMIQELEALMFSVVKFWMISVLAKDSC